MIDGWGYFVLFIGWLIKYCERSFLCFFLKCLLCILEGKNVVMGKLKELVIVLKNVVEYSF